MKMMSTDEMDNATEIVRQFRSADPAFKKLQTENEQLTAELTRVKQQNAMLFELFGSASDHMKAAHDLIEEILPCAYEPGYPLQNKFTKTARNNTVSNDPKVALFGALTRSPQILSTLEKTARQNGFAGAVNTLRKRLQNLERDGSVIGESENPRTWRLK